MHRLILTFDVEDFINPNAMGALHTILRILEKHKLRGLFFVTGHVAEKLGDFSELSNLLKNHEIGFHSSGHSVRPIILEYADVKSYRQAYSLSIERETAHINPLTGKTEGEGGIHSLQDLFGPKKIEAYRAPGMSWTPPHLEALADLGIKYDFSSSITGSEPAQYKKIIFYPFTFTQKWDGSLSDYAYPFREIFKNKVSVLGLHPSLLANQVEWDSIYHKGNPPALQRIAERPLEEAASLFARFEVLLKMIIAFQRIGPIEIDPHPDVETKDLVLSEDHVEECYRNSVTWPRRYFQYSPRFVHDHFQEFFEITHHKELSLEQGAH